MSREMTAQFVQLLFDNDLITSSRNQEHGSASVYAHYPNGSKLRVNAAKTDLVRLEETTITGAQKILSMSTREALEYVKRWSLDADNGGVFVGSVDEAYRAARALLESMESVDVNAVDVKKFTAYISYPRVGNYSVHGLLVRLPDAPSHLAAIVDDCIHED